MLKIETSYGKGWSTEEDDQGLTTNHKNHDDDEEFVFRDSREDIESIIESTAIDFVENLKPYECIEYNCFHNDGVPCGEEMSAVKIKDKYNDKLNDRLTENHFPHVERNQ